MLFVAMVVTFLRNLFLHVLLFVLFLWFQDSDLFDVLCRILISKPRSADCFSSWFFINEILEGQFPYFDAKGQFKVVVVVKKTKIYGT